MTWEMKYMTRGEYINALGHALAQRDVVDADIMIAEFKYYFFKQNSLGIGDTEVIQSLPDPEALAQEYDGKEYSNRRALKKSGSMGAVGRFGLGILTFFAGFFGLVTTLISYAAILAGALLLVLATIYAFHLDGILPDIVMGVLSQVPIGIFSQSMVGLLSMASAGVFLILLFVTIAKALHRLRQKYHNWTLEKISGCFRLPVCLDDVYSKVWRALVYILMPLSLITAAITAGMLILGINFTV